MKSSMDVDLRETKAARGSDREKNRWQVQDFLHIGLMGFPQQGMISIDATHRCNLSCRHCYFKGQGYRTELTLNEWADWFDKKQMENHPFLICGWLGGEPLLRPELLEMGLSYFKSNVIFTNGTVELKPWADCTFVVSVPGLKDQYPAITGTNRKTFERVRAHADRSDIQVFVSFCVTRRTTGLIPRVLEEWSQTAVRGVYFEFYTPSVGGSLGLWVDWEIRDRILSQLLEMKKNYGDFIANTEQELTFMQSHNFRAIVGDCPFHMIGASFDPMGRRKLPCAVGPKADCSRCGCILPAFAQILSRRRFMVQALWNGLQRELRVRRTRQIQGRWSSVFPSRSSPTLKSKVEDGAT